MGVRSVGDVIDRGAVPNMTDRPSDLRDDPSRSLKHPPGAVLDAFDSRALAWNEYLSTPLGRLRRELSLHFLSENLAGPGSGLRALDAGGGTGSYAVELAELGYHVCLLDFSAEMLALARERILSHDPDLLELIYFRQGDVEEIDGLFPAGYFDLILCHTLLEYLAQPLEVAGALATALGAEGLVSFVLTNPEADALRIALTRHDPKEAHLALEGSSSAAHLFGLSRRIIPPKEVAEKLGQLGMVKVADYGVRVVADYLPPEKLADPQFYGELFELEKALGRLQAYKPVGRYRQLLMRKSGAASPTG